jgi:septal ring factor EnvC (AmiA/AmiB activator)
MTKLDDQISDLKQQRATLVKRLEQDYGDIAGLATALVRLRSIPPEAIMARPGAPLDTAQAAMILRRVVGPLQANAAALGRDLDRLATLETSLNERQQTLRLATRQIREEQTKLAELMRRREAAYTNLRADLVEQETQLAALARDAADFRDLIDKLERRNQELSAGSPSGLATPASIPPRLDIERRILRSLGDIQLPISGVIRVAYGATDEMGSASQGWRIEGRGGALVVAPMNGIIKYQGNFKNYGNMIIIEHAKNYHSLVAGLSKIDTVVGQSVEAGEPLGTLAAPRAERPAVYYELRQNGKPVNPSRLFADIG